MVFKIKYIINKTPQTLNHCKKNGVPLLPRNGKSIVTNE